MLEEFSQDVAFAFVVAAASAVTSVAGNANQRGLISTRFFLSFYFLSEVVWLDFYNYNVIVYDCCKQCFFDSFLHLSEHFEEYDTKANEEASNVTTIVTEQPSSGDLQQNTSEVNANFFFFFCSVFQVFFDFF